MKITDEMSEHILNNVSANPHFYVDMTIYYQLMMLDKHNDSLEPFVRGSETFDKMLTLAEDGLDAREYNACLLAAEAIKRYILENQESMKRLVPFISNAKEALPKDSVNQESLDKMREFANGVRESMN